MTRRATPSRQAQRRPHLGEHLAGRRRLKNRRWRRPAGHQQLKSPQVEHRYSGRPWVAQEGEEGSSKALQAWPKVGNQVSHETYTLSCLRVEFAVLPF
jgi:hypothetical protein